jgi:glutamate synthase domain-containing protein 3
VVILGPTGRNFAAGMSGGVAYLWDPTGTARIQCNAQMVDIEALADAEDIAELKSLLENHVRYTGSAVADKILKDWTASIAKFVRVMPKDYKRALAAYKRVVAQGLSGDAADMAAFQENMKDLSRVGGN